MKFISLFLPLIFYYISLTFVFHYVYKFFLLFNEFLYKLINKDFSRKDWYYEKFFYYIR